jgi:hypothetical protein
LHEIDAPFLELQRVMVPPWMQPAGGLHGTNRD